MKNAPHAHVAFRRELRASGIVFIAAWPTILGLQTLLRPLIGNAGPVVQAGLLCAIMAPLLTFVFCPLLDHFLPGRASPSTPETQA